MAVDSASERIASPFASVIQDHLELKKQNADLDGQMPLDRYQIEDPFENHPLFKSEEQARIEETLDGEPAIELHSLSLPGRARTPSSMSAPKAPPSTATSGVARATSTGASNRRGTHVRVAGADRRAAACDHPGSSR